MRLSLRHLSVVALPALLAGCLDVTRPEGTPIDCSTLATTLDASAGSLTTMTNGVKYRDTRIGGGALVEPGQTVLIHYSACLTDGTVFDKNLDVDPPALFTIGAHTIIPGVEDGVVGMHVGGRRQLVVPPALAYGTAGVPGRVPPNATVVFTIDMLLAQAPVQ